MIKTCKTALTAFALASLPLIAACGEQDETPPETATRDDGTLTLAAGLVGLDQKPGEEGLGFDKHWSEYYYNSRNIKNGMAPDEFIASGS